MENTLPSRMGIVLPARIGPLTDRVTSVMHVSGLNSLSFCHRKTSGRCLATKVGSTQNHNARAPQARISAMNPEKIAESRRQTHPVCAALTTGYLEIPLPWNRNDFASRPRTAESTAILAGLMSQRAFAEPLGCLTQTIFHCHRWSQQFDKSIGIQQ